MQIMKPLGSVEFSIEELPDKLQIRYARRAGWIERIVAPAIVASSILIGWFWQNPVLIVGASGLILLLILRWAWGHESVLRIFPDRLIASSYFRNTMETTLSNVETIRWLRQDSSEGGVQEGLHISRAGRPECILPFVSEEQARSVTEAISRKFPEYPINVPIRGSIWFEAPPDMTAFTIQSRTDLDPTKRT
jgi:hypothetical protein